MESGGVKEAVSTLVDTKVIIRKWETAVLTAGRLFRNVENHWARAGHLGFQMIQLDKAQDGTGLTVTMCGECGEELDRTRKLLTEQVRLLTYDIWNQMVREAKVELKARTKAKQSA